MSKRKRRKKFKTNRLSQKTKEKNLDPKLSKELDFFINSALKSANSLSKKLFKDDAFYKQASYAWVGEKDSKKLFLYGVCKEVMKIQIASAQIKDAFKKIPTDDAKDLHDFLGNTIIGSFLDDQALRLRKAIELLSILVLFLTNTVHDEEYRIFLSAENLDFELSRQTEFKGFFGETISNTQHSIDDYNNRIKKDLNAISKKEVWFLDMDKLDAGKPSVFKSKRSLYLSALEVANDDERVMMGISYHKTYSRLSMTAHPTFGSHDYGDKENDYRQVLKNIPTIGLACMHVMKIAHLLAKEDDPNGIDKILGKNNERSEASKFIAKMVRDFEVGDIALTAWEDLVEIVDKKTSKYGYKAYKIKFISRPPLPEFPEDWIEAQQILTLLLKKSAVRKFMEKGFEVATNPMLKEMSTDVLAQSDDILMESAKKTFLDLHQHGILIPMLVKNGHLKPADKSII